MTDVIDRREIPTATPDDRRHRPTRKGVNMTQGSYRVAVWATGGIGSIAIRAIQHRPLTIPKGAFASA
jgi:hypothetical protein